MTLHVDLYYTLRSPYCYLAVPRLVKLVTTFDLQVNLKPVYPLAISDTTFFKRVHPLWLGYIRQDVERLARRLQIPFGWPQPDPIVHDPATGRVATQQPDIQRLTHLAQVAAEQGKGLEFVAAVSTLLFNPNGTRWDRGHALEIALSQAGLDLRVLEHSIRDEPDRLDGAIAANREQQLAAGHWGTPLFVFQREIFFGQDRIEDLTWTLKQNGLQHRATRPESE